MLQSLVETIIESGLQVIGWAVLKTLSLGRYRGFQAEDTMREGVVGLAALAVAGYGAYRWIATALGIVMVLHCAVVAAELDPLSGTWVLNKARSRNESVADSTFVFRGRPVFGYRSVQSADRRSLTMISVDPETRSILSAVVVYDRR